MSYAEKRTATIISTMALVFAAYCIYAFTRIQIQGPLRTWAITMLVFSGITILVIILVQILFHILLSVGIAVKEAVKNPNVDKAVLGQSVEDEFVEDERDKLLALKSSQVSYGISGFGFIAGLISLVLNAPPAVMLNIVFTAGFLGSIIEGIVTLIYYRRGY